MIDGHTHTHTHPHTHALVAEPGQAVATEVVGARTSEGVGVGVRDGRSHAQLQGLEARGCENSSDAATQVQLQHAA